MSLDLDAELAALVREAHAQDPHDRSKSEKVDRRLTHSCARCGHGRLAHEHHTVSTHCCFCGTSACPYFQTRWVDRIGDWVWWLLGWLVP